MKKKLESFLVCADFSNDIPVLVVGTKVKNGINIINAFQGEEAEKVQQGYTVFNPAWMDFSGEWTKQDKRAIDAVIMSRCDAVYQLPGWDGLENSGSRMEYAFAQGAGMIFLEKDANGFFFVVNKEN